MTAHSAKCRRDARDSSLLTVLVVGLTALTLCPAALATYGGYAGDGFYAAGADPCEQHGSTVVGAPTTGYDPLTGEWFDEYSCADNTKVRVPRAAPPPREEEAGYDPDPPPPAACTEAHYSDDPDNPWDEGTC